MVDFMLFISGRFLEIKDPYGDYHVIREYISSKKNNSCKDLNLYSVSIKKMRNNYSTYTLKYTISEYKYNMIKGDTDDRTR